MLAETSEGLLFVPAAPTQGSALTDADFDRFARIVGCGTAAHAGAVFDVEAAGAGFTSHRGRRVPKILFEAHIFYKLSGRFPVSRVAPHLSSRHWNRSLYNRTARPRRSGENVAHLRLEEAVALDEHFDAGGALRLAALASCSWGIGQVMGYHAEALGYAGVQAFVNEMHRGEGAQLDAVARFVKVNGLATALCRQDWQRFARGYNGAGYRVNRYDSKLAAAYARRVRRR